MVGSRDIVRGTQQEDPEGDNFHNLSFDSLQAKAEIEELKNKLATAAATPVDLVPKQRSVSDDTHSLTSDMPSPSTQTSPASAGTLTTTPWSKDVGGLHISLADTHRDRQRSRRSPLSAAFQLRSQADLQVLPDQLPVGSAVDTCFRPQHHKSGFCWTCLCR